MNNSYNQYLSALRHPFKKLSKLEFLQPDGSVAFSLGNNFKTGYNQPYDSCAFLQGGTLNVSLQNGKRRSASLTLSNLDDAFDYSVNKIWFGSQVRLSMGLVLPNGQEFYLPQGVFYFSDPNKVLNPDSREMSYQLVDKWAYLDGTLFGQIPYSHKILEGTNYFTAAQNLLHLSKYNMEDVASFPKNQIDSVPPVFTDYYNDLPNISYIFYKPDGTEEIRTAKANETPYEIVTEMGGTIADSLLEINTSCVGLIGYDPTGALRIDSAQASLLDVDKPVLWSFDPANSDFLGLTEVSKNTETFNSVFVSGEGLSNGIVWARVTNTDPSSDTNVYVMGLKTFTENKAEFWSVKQCRDWADYTLKQKAIVQKSISIRSSQMFHLIENNLISVKRIDKEGSPVEKHLIQSFSIPIGETGEMTINATSVNDFNLSTEVSTSEEES
jgi:hypothetical protein